MGTGYNDIAGRLTFPFYAQMSGFIGTGFNAAVDRNRASSGQAPDLVKMTEQLSSRLLFS